jgi:hypothetical protein
MLIDGGEEKLEEDEAAVAAFSCSHRCFLCAGDSDWCCEERDALAAAADAEAANGADAPPSSASANARFLLDAVEGSTEDEGDPLVS